MGSPPSLQPHVIHGLAAIVGASALSLGQLACRSIATKVVAPEQEWAAVVDCLAFFLHAVDRYCFASGGPIRRDRVLAELMPEALDTLLIVHWHLEHRDSTPELEHWMERTIAASMQQMTAARAEYGKCPSLMGDDEQAFNMFRTDNSMGRLTSRLAQTLEIALEFSAHLKICAAIGGLMAEGGDPRAKSRSREVARSPSCSERTMEERTVIASLRSGSLSGTEGFLHRSVQFYRSFPC